MTLLEALIVVALVALIAGLSFPSVTSGLDTLRLRSASDSIVSFLNIALDHADRRQQAVEVIGFSRRLEMPAQIHILGDANETRRFLVYPGGSIPRIGIQIATMRGRSRMVSVDPVTGSPGATQ
jgi:Tfp pilus assembly protein FimT